MSLPTIEQVTKLFLFGTEKIPNSFEDESLIRPDNPEHFEVNAKEYMEIGPGRYALPSISPIVKKFFGYVGNIPGIVFGEEYTATQILSKLGGSPDKDWGTYVQQYNYDLESNDYLERVYIWNSTGFKINDDARFVISATGNRYIKNLAMVPKYDKVNKNKEDEWKKENFDFKSDDSITGIANTLLESYIDPSHIGRTVIFDFTYLETIPQRNYDYYSYQIDIKNESSLYTTIPVALWSVKSEICCKFTSNRSLTNLGYADNAATVPRFRSVIRVAAQS